MREHLERRLAELEGEFRAGQKTMLELESGRTNLRETLLRISGAIQVLEEVLAAPAEVDGDNVEPLKKVVEDA